MQLNEPKKKRRVRLQAQPPLPVTTDENGGWRIYTAHLSATGTCIVDPGEMEAVYSMGFFGKGSLSRSYPSFGRRRFGAPPIARNRQWVRRQKWLEELQNLNDNSESEPDPDDGIDENLQKELITGNSCPENIHESNCRTLAEPKETIERESGEQSLKDITDESNKKSQQSTLSPARLEQSPASTVDKSSVAEPISDGLCSKKTKFQHPPIAKTDPDTKRSEKTVEIVKFDDNKKDAASAKREESTRVDEVVLDSTEDEEVCEIVERASTDVENSVHGDICVLNVENPMERSDEYFEEESVMEDDPDPYEVLVLPDTDSDTENYLKNVKSRIEKEGFPVNETLHLTFEETFFLMYALGCLQLIHYDGSVFSISNAWNHFQMQDNFFIQKYVVYHYFRSKGWIVKPGLKYGGDFLLYKQGPPFYHASYIVIVEVMDADTLIRDDVKSMRKLTWKRLIGIERLSETISKEILFAQILWPSSIPRNGNPMPVDALSEFTVRELLWRRWNPKRKHEIVSVDEQDSDSA